VINNSEIKVKQKRALIIITANYFSLKDGLIKNELIGSKMSLMIIVLKSTRKPWRMTRVPSPQIPVRRPV
jgi:hypothetical protein